MQPISYARHQFPPEIIRHAVWLYLRFTLSYRDVEELLAERGSEISYDLFRGNVLRIPRFQRPYCWDKENLSDFWFDLVLRTDDEYFMGSAVIFRDGKERNLYHDSRCNRR